MLSTETFLAKKILMIWTTLVVPNDLLYMYLFRYQAAR